MRPELVVAVLDVADAPAKLQAKLTASLEFIRAHPVLAEIFLLSRRELLANLEGVMDNTLNESLSLTRELLADGVSNGQLRADLDVDASAQVIELIQMSLSEAVLGISGLEYREDMLPAAQGFVLNAITGSQPS